MSTRKKTVQVKQNNNFKTQKKTGSIKKGEIQHKQQTTVVRRDFFKSLINTR